MLADLHSAPTVLILILLGGVLAAALWIAMTALRQPEEPVKRRPGTGRIVVGPGLRDGVWCRLVAYDDGHRRVEVLGPQGWVASHRNVAHLMQAIPGRSIGNPPKG
jgi:hypothetical protein